MNFPLVSVIIPVYNGERFLAEALDSIHAQNYQPLQIIVVDDGSTDKSSDIAQSDSQVIYFYQKNQGQAVARNYGISQSQGEFIAFLDQDDLWPKNSLKKMVEVLIALPDIDFAQGLVQEYNYDLDVNEFHISDKLPYWHVNLGSTLFRKSVFFKIGLLSEQLSGSDDLEWFMRAWYQNIKNYHLKRLTLLFRKHDKNMSLDIKTMKTLMLKTYFKHLTWKRNNPDFSHTSGEFLEYIGFNKYLRKELDR